MKEVDISKMTVEELKAMAYDLMVEIQKMNNNLQIISSEIAKKADKDLSSGTKDNGTEIINK